MTNFFFYCKSLPFFSFLTFEKADCSIFALLVGWSVGWSVDVTINSFNIYRHKSPLLTQYHSIPISTNQYQVILTQYHLVTTSITPYWPSTIKYQPVLPCKGPVLSYIMMSIATVSIDHNSNKRFALFTWSSSFQVSKVKIKVKGLFCSMYHPTKISDASQMRERGYLGEKLGF